MKSFIFIAIVLISNFVFASGNVEAVSDKSLVSIVNFGSPAIAVKNVENQKVQIILDWAMIHDSDNHASADQRWLEKLSETYKLDQVAVLVLTFDQADCIQNKKYQNIFECNATNKEVSVQAGSYYDNSTNIILSPVVIHSNYTKVITKLINMMDVEGNKYSSFTADVNVGGLDLVLNKANLGNSLSSK